MNACYLSEGLSHSRTRVDVSQKQRIQVDATIKESPWPSGPPTGMKTQSICRATFAIPPLHLQRSGGQAFAEQDSEFSASMRDAI